MLHSVASDKSLQCLTESWVKVQFFQNPELLKLQSSTCSIPTSLNIHKFNFNGQLSLNRLYINRKSLIISPIQKVSLKMLNSGIILKTFTHAVSHRNDARLIWVQSAQM